MNKIPNFEDDLAKARGSVDLATGKDWTAIHSCDPALFRDIDFKEKQTQPGVRLNGKWDHLGDEFECDLFPQPGIYLGDNKTRFNGDGLKIGMSIGVSQVLLSRRYYFNESFPGLFRGSWVIYSGFHSLLGNFYTGKTDKVFPCVSIDGFKRYKLGKCMEMNVLYYPSRDLESVIRKRGLTHNIPAVCKIIKSVIPKFWIDFDEVNREGWVFIDDDQFAVTEKDYERIARAVQDSGFARFDPKAISRKNGINQAVHMQP